MDEQKYLYHFEFYDRISNQLDHNQTYHSVEEAFRNAKGRIAVCVSAEPDNSVNVPRALRLIDKINARYIEDVEKENIQYLHAWAQSQHRDFSGLSMQEILNIYNRSLGYNSWDEFYAQNPSGALKAWEKSTKKSQ